MGIVNARSAIIGYCVFLGCFERVLCMLGVL
jgi:hypothetical protein